jgi:hypothetical protein
MTEQEILMIRLRALNPERRTDFARLGCPDLESPASHDLVVSSEREIGFPLWTDHRQILTELANGGFGPGDGLLGIHGGRVDDGGRTLIELRHLILSPEELRLPIVPLCDWGGGAWSMLDCQTGEILTCSELGLKELGVTFNVWLSQWAGGKNWWQEMFEFDSVEVVDPKTGIRSKVSRIRGVE